MLRSSKAQPGSYYASAQGADHQQHSPQADMGKVTSHLLTPAWDTTT